MLYRYNIDMIGLAINYDNIKNNNIGFTSGQKDRFLCHIGSTIILLILVIPLSLILVIIKYITLWNLLN